MNDNIQGYLDKGEIDYIGTPNWATVLSGNNRIQLLWIVNSDPRIEQCTVYWNNGLDSATCQVTPKLLSEISGLPDTLVIPQEVDTVGAKYMTLMLDNMPENTYIFNMFQTGSLGHRSVRYELTGQSYGDSYQQTLINRILKNAVYTTDTGVLNIVWSAAEVGEVGMQVEYFDVNDANNPKTLMISANDTTVSIRGFDKDKPVYYSTFYKPNVMAIDAFHVAQSEISYSVIAKTPENVTSIYLKNTQTPFTHGAAAPNDAGQNRFYMLTDWIVNAPCLATGNLDVHPYFGTGAMGFEQNGTDIINGKLYQTVTLPAGNYRFVANYVEDQGAPEAYVVANIGSDLPNMDLLATTAAAYTPISYNSDSNPYTIRFTLPETSTVSLGFVGSCYGGQRVMFNRVELWSE